MTPPVPWLLLCLVLPPPASSQSSFSPFSLLGSLFSSGPSWPPHQSRPRPEPRQPQPVQARQSRQPPPGGLHFRAKIPNKIAPKIALGHNKFSASQVRDDTK